jgi:TM2 domain-containing membrane protein YozV
MNNHDFLMINANKFPRETLPQLQQRLDGLTPESQYSVMSVSYKEPLVAFVLSFFLGTLGIDRFYVGDTGLGVGKLVATVLTFGIVGGIWWFVDLFLIMRACRLHNYEQAIRMMAYAQPRQQAAQAEQAPQSDDSSDFDDF